MTSSVALHTVIFCTSELGCIGWTGRLSGEEQRAQNPAVREIQGTSQAPACLWEAGPDPDTSDLWAGETMVMHKAPPSLRACDSMALHTYTAQALSPAAVT